MKLQQGVVGELDGMKATLQDLRQHFGRQTEEVHVRKAGFSLKHASTALTFARWLEQESRAKVLDLQNAQLTPGSAEKVAEAIRRSSSVEVLRLSSYSDLRVSDVQNAPTVTVRTRSRTVPSEPDMLIVGILLSQNATLQTLSFEGTPVGGSRLKQLTQMLRDTACAKSVRRLSLARCCLDDAQLSDVVQLCDALPALDEVDLSGNADLLGEDSTGQALRDALNASRSTSPIKVVTDTARRSTYHGL